MNCPSHTDDPIDQPQWNQSPPLLSRDLTTRQDMNGRANGREHRDRTTDENHSVSESTPLIPFISRGDAAVEGRDPKCPNSISRAFQILRKFARFVGPGFLVAVAYIDPGNYATDVAAGAETKYALLFIIMVSSLFAMFLQSLCIQLGSVTGLNLAENCKAHLPKWLNILLYAFTESAIIATDIAEVRIPCPLTQDHCSRSSGCRFRYLI